MSSLSKFYALSAIYFGLASAVGAQTASGTATGSTESTGDKPRQESFQHPMLESQPSNDARPGAVDDQRIQRRGMGEVRQDGEIRRNPAPGAAARSGELMPPRNRQEAERGTPERLGQSQ